MSRFPDGREIYEYMKSQLNALLPSLEGPVVDGLLRVVAAGISILINAVKWTYWNAFPHTADREGLRRWFEAWGLTYDDTLSTDEMRKQVLSAFRTRGVGTKEWYKQIILENFSGWVDRVDVRSWAGVVEIIVSNGGNAVSESTIQNIENLLNSDNFRVAGVEIIVRTKGEEHEMELPISNSG